MSLLMPLLPVAGVAVSLVVLVVLGDVEVAAGVAIDPLVLVEPVLFVEPLVLGMLGSDVPLVPRVPFVLTVPAELVPPVVVEPLVVEPLVVLDCA